MRAITHSSRSHSEASYGDQGRVAFGPEWVLPAGPHSRLDHGVGQADPPGEYGRVDSPLVLGAAAGAGSQDHQLAVATLERPATQ